MLIKHIFAASAFIAFSVPANATTTEKICSYRPSEVFGGGGAAALTATGTGLAAAGMGAKAAGFYTLTHATTGLTMLGSTAGGASAAGTVGIMGGTGGAIGGAVAAVTAPVTIFAAALLAAGVAGFEGACFFADERITEHAEVLLILQDVEKNADPELFRVWKNEESREWIVGVRGENGLEQYKVENLYIVNGTLMHRDWFRNTTIGYLGFLVPAEEE